MAGGIRISIDRGGTFTDCVGNPGTGRMEDDVVIKLLSVDPANYDDAPLEGIRRLVQKFTGVETPKNSAVDTTSIESIRMGTTVATNALLERKGERCAFITTKGFKDSATIGNQSRPKIFDLAIRRPGVLYEKTVEIDERVTLEDFTENPKRTVTSLDGEKPDPQLVKGLSGEIVRILTKPDSDVVRRQLRELRADGFDSIAICLMHSYTFPDHEKLVGQIAEEIGFSNISLSSDLISMIKLVPRATSSIADAYLTPETKKYVNGFRSKLAGSQARLELMQSDGGLVDVSSFSGLRAILSGPAGGVVGYAMTSYDSEAGVPVLGFDMGGTSTDVSRYGGRLEHVFETTTAGVTIQSPQLDINTVAAGGGSRLFWKNGMFVVGPESAGAHPGPACYRKGGPLTVTDANLYLGRLLPELFPKIFGENEDQPLDVEITRKKFEELTDDINRHVEEASRMTPDEVAEGFLRVANETMTRPIRSLTESKGFAASRHHLASFGGAGGQHAVAIADSLGIDKVLIHRHSSVLSAYGMALANVVHEVQEPCSDILNEKSMSGLSERFDRLREKASTALREQGFSDDTITHEAFLNLRYRGTESALMIPESSEGLSFLESFIDFHKREFGFILDGRDVLVDDARVRGIGRAREENQETALKQMAKLETENSLKEVDPAKAADFWRPVYFEGSRQNTPIYTLESLNVGEQLTGPAILADGTQTILISPKSVATILRTHVVIDLTQRHAQDTVQEDGSKETKTVNPILLSVFGHRFMSIAEQMGHTLQKTSVSTNVKERLDYSCAIFDVNGDLVANAPHLPVHLGSMSTCVRLQTRMWEGKLKPGDVLVANHPSYGGTHLPDITTISPAFHEGNILFYVASRAHHADIGGLLPGSMPPNSKELTDEGAAIISEKMVSEGRFEEERMKELLLEEPAKQPGSSGTRCLGDNISDLKAQVAANQKGIRLIDSLIAEYGEHEVMFYMTAIQDNAEQAVRKLLRKVYQRFQGKDLVSVDHMDDGSAIKLAIKIDEENGEASFDFTGTGPEMYGNLNAPEAVTYSAIIYALRCLVAEDIPLNQGCLKPVKVNIPQGSLLSPNDGAAVVGGNVMTSQRVTDVIFKAFQACAASQGDCNNLTFGYGGNAESGYTEGFGYYETIAGGSGAGPTWDGTSGVHTHMTNTRITDAEIFERRYPVILREFSLREGSGGAGAHPGGDGVVREIEFRFPVQVSILSERRVHQPYGMDGGSPAVSGLNIWKRGVRDADGKITHYRHINLGSRNTASMKPGDSIIINTPGGGGYGAPNQNQDQEQSTSVGSMAEQMWRGMGSLAARGINQITA